MINYKDDNAGSRTSTAVKYVNKYFRPDHEFYQHYTRVKFPLYMSDIHLADVIKLMSKYMDENLIEVNHWKPWNRWTKAIAMTRGVSINLNVRKMYRPVGDIVETLTHETVHIVDNSNFKYSFGHGSNDPKGKRYTAPYIIGELANRYYTTGELADVHEI
jgi:hypothetical protein